MHSAVVRFLACMFMVCGLASMAQAQELNTDRPGRDYRSFALSKADYKLCQSACQADASCKAFTYVNPGLRGSAAMCFLKSAVPPKVSNSCCVSGTKTVAEPPADAGDEARCRTYASEANRQNNENLRLRCKFTGSRWSSDKAGHFDWCMNNNAAAAAKETSFRTSQLATCSSGADTGDDEEPETPSKASICKTYADDAIKAFAASEKLECGFTGDRWTENRKSHYTWCMGANDQQRLAESKARQSELARCRASDGGDNKDETPPTDQQGCREFSQRSVAQALKNKKLGCGFGGQRWTTDSNIHRQFCRTKPQEVRSTLRERDRLLSLCEDHPLRVTACRRYANSSIAQQKTNLARQCGFSGPKWSENYDIHFAWCLTKRRPDQVIVLMERDHSLARCE